MTDEQRAELEQRIAAALGDGWSMDEPADKAAAVAALLAALEAVGDGS